MGRAPCCEKVGLKRGRWTVEEDEKLTNYILQHGEGSWRSLPKNAGLLRCGKSCRLRWINYLRSDLKRGNITSQEEDTIIKLHATLGNRWSSIAGQLPGRTDNEIKNYWNSHLSRRIHTIRRPNGEENVINLTNASAPPKRRGGRTSRAAMQRNKTNNNNNNNNNNVTPQLRPMLGGDMVGNENLMFDSEVELLGIEDMMGLDGLLSTTNDENIRDNDVSPIGLTGVGPIGEDQEQCSGSNGGGSTSTSSSPSSLSCFDHLDGGLSWDTNIGMVDDVGPTSHLSDEVISWLWENDDNFFGEFKFTDTNVSVDFDKEQAMVAWLLS